MNALICRDYLNRRSEPSPAHQVLSSFGKGFCARLMTIDYCSRVVAEHY